MRDTATSPASSRLCPAISRTSPCPGWAFSAARQERPAVPQYLRCTVPRTTLQSHHTVPLVTHFFSTRPPGSSPHPVIFPSMRSHPGNTLPASSHPAMRIQKPRCQSTSNISREDTDGYVSLEGGDQLHRYRFPSSPLCSHLYNGLHKSSGYCSEAKSQTPQGDREKTEHTLAQRKRLFYSEVWSK